MRPRIAWSRRLACQELCVRAKWVRALDDDPNTHEQVAEILGLAACHIAEQRERSGPHAVPLPLSRKAQCGHCCYGIIERMRYALHKSWDSLAMRDHRVRGADTVLSAPGKYGGSNGYDAGRLPRSSPPSSDAHSSLLYRASGTRACAGHSLSCSTDPCSTLRRET